MTNSSLIDELVKFKTFNEALPKIKETLGAPNSLSESHLKLAYSVKGQQPEVARQLISDVVQYTEDEKVKETDDNTDHQSSSTTGLKKEGEEHEAPEGVHAQPDAKDQMGVTVGETYPGMPPQQQPMQQSGNGFPPQQPQGTCGGQHPPMQNPQQQQMMQYTISEVIRQITPQINAMKEAITAVDKKVQEASRIQPERLEVPSARVSETAPLPNGYKEPKRWAMSKKAQEISRMNDMLDKARL